MTDTNNIPINSTHTLKYHTGHIADVGVGRQNCFGARGIAEAMIHIYAFVIIDVGRYIHSHELIQTYKHGKHNGNVLFQRIGTRQRRLDRDYRMGIYSTAFFVKVSIHDEQVGENLCCW